MADHAQAAAHWDAAYAEGDDTRSWFKKRPAVSLRMLDSAGVSAAFCRGLGRGCPHRRGRWRFPSQWGLLDRGFRDRPITRHKLRAEVCRAATSSRSAPARSA